jgi:hypothetical protein
LITSRLSRFSLHTSRNPWWTGSSTTSRWSSGTFVDEDRKRSMSYSSAMVE